MGSVIPLILRRMRAPLILLISAYAIAVLGFVLIPGQDDTGQAWRMDFFHAFYFVSYMATTIGFGEIPYAFTGAQRLWASFSIYLTVISWFYALGSIIALIQEPAFQAVMARNRFRRGVRFLREPFYLVCGYGDTGAELVRALSARGTRAVVIDIDPDRVNELSINDLPLFVPGLCGDANLTNNLLRAGLRDDWCVGVLAVTNSDQTNLQIAISTKLLNPPLPVICRAELRETVANMRSFGTDHVVNPFEDFAVNLVTAIRSPEMQLLEEWLTALPGAPLTEPSRPPNGRWIICGYGRLGQAVHRYLGYQGVPVTLVDLNPPPPDLNEPYIRGKGTEAVTLREARVETAAAVFAATDNDADNLSIVMTARELNPNLFLLARQNNRWADAVFEAARLPWRMTPSEIIAAEMLSLLGAPHLRDFLREARHQRHEWAQQLIARLREISGGVIPAVWTITLDASEAPAVMEALNQNRPISLGMLEANPRRREQRLPCVSLMLLRNGSELLLPEPQELLKPGDRLLLAAPERVRGQLNLTLRNYNALRYVETGEQRPDGWLWRWLARRQKARRAPG